MRAIWPTERSCNRRCPRTDGRRSAPPPSASRLRRGGLKKHETIHRKPSVIGHRPPAPSAAGRQPALSRRPLRHEPARDGDRETALPAVVPRAGGRSFGRRAGAGRLERIETRPDRSGIHHRTAAPGRARSPLDSGAMEPQRAERLPARHRRRLRHGVRRQPRPLRILGLPARQLRAAIPRLAQRGAGERHGRPAPAATAGRRGGLRRHGVVLPARTAALQPRPAVDTSRRQHAGAAAGGRSALPADPRRGVGGNGQRLEGLFQRPDVPEPCGGQSAFLVPLDPVGRRRRPLRIRILPRTGACGDLRAAARRPACRDRNRHAAAHPTAERRAVPGRKLRPLDGRPSVSEANP